MSNVLTFDFGTTYFKVCVFDEALRLVARRQIAVPVEHPAPGRAELSLAAFRQCVTAVVKDINRQVGGLTDVSRICFASQANSFVLLDSSSNALIPFLLWTDERARGLERLVPALASRADFYATTGVAQLDHHFMLAKIRWLQEYEPNIISRTRRLCGLSDYFVSWMTGNHLTEIGIAGLTGLADIHRIQYWDEAVREMELPREWLPQITRAGSDAGQLRKEIVLQWGVSHGCRLDMGCLDQYAGAIGAGNTEPGRASETTGTVLATIRCARGFAADSPPGVFQGPAFAPGLYYQMVFSEVSAGLLEKYRNHLPDRPTFRELDELAERVPFGAEGLRLHPEAFRRSGEDMFIHRLDYHHRGHEVRAILEAVALELRRQLQMLCGHDWPETVWAAGGAARSRLWLQIKSQVVGCRVQPVECPEPTSLGAARLAQGSCTAHRETIAADRNRPPHRIGGPNPFPSHPELPTLRQI